MRRLVVALVVSLVALGGVGTARAQGEVQGWTLRVEVPVHGCLFEGLMQLYATDVGFAGVATATHVAGDIPPCPEVLIGTQAQVSGTIIGQTITFGVVTSMSGTVLFEGSVAPDFASAEGVWTIDSLTGPWFARKIQSSSVPTMSTLGVGTLGVLLVAGGISLIRRRHPRT